MSANLLDGVSVNTTGVGAKADGSSKVVAIWATDFGTGTVTLQGSPDGGGTTDTWVTLTIGGSAAEFTANAIRLIDKIGQGMHTRAILTGANGSTDTVSVKLFD